MSAFSPCANASSDSNAPTDSKSVLESDETIQWLTRELTSAKRQIQREQQSCTQLKKKLAIARRAMMVAATSGSGKRSPQKKCRNTKHASRRDKDQTTARRARKEDGGVMSKECDTADSTTDLANDSWSDAKWPFEDTSRDNWR